MIPINQSMECHKGLDSVAQLKSAKAEHPKPSQTIPFISGTSLSCCTCAPFGPMMAEPTFTLSVVNSWVKGNWDTLELKSDHS